jgi:hypothetical protein
MMIERYCADVVALAHALGRVAVLPERLERSCSYEIRFGSNATSTTWLVGLARACPR